MKTNTVIIIAAAVVVLVIVGAVGAYFLLLQNQPKAEAPVKTYSYSIGDFIATNIKDSRRVIKVDLTLEIIDGSKDKDIAYLDEKNSLIRDTIIGILRSRTLEDYNKPDVEESIKKDIIDSLTISLDFEKITSVYFREFILP